VAPSTLCGVMPASLLGQNYTNEIRRCKWADLHVCWWALRGSNPRPSPCKGDALPTELSARFRGRMSARPTDHITELDRQPRAAARSAPVEPVGPARLRLTRRADEHLPPAGHRSRPRHRTLVGVVGRATASPACRSIHRRVGSVERPHVGQDTGASRRVPARRLTHLGHPEER
jgi:hypothetical protein